MTLSNYIKSFVKENSLFFYSLYFTSILALIYLMMNSKGDLVLFFAANRSAFLNDLFKVASVAGEGIHFAYLLIILSLFKLRYLILGLITFLGTGAITQVIKNILDEPRPALWFTDTAVLNFVEGVRIAKYLSFPSGHTTTAFAMCIFFLIFTKNKFLQILLFLAAMIMALSRVYLAQHFLLDIVVGSFIGSFGAILFAGIFESNPKIKDSKWYNFSLLDKLRGN